MESLSETAERTLRMVREAPKLSYDTETSGVDWRVNFPVGYVIGTDATDMAYVPVRHGGGGNLPDAAVQPPSAEDDPIVIHRYERELSKAFADRTRLNVGPTIGHNLKFDAHFSANAGVMLGRDLVCTQNTEALLDEYARGYGLGDCSKRHGVTAKLGDELYQHIANQFGVPNNRKAMSHFWRLSGADPIAVEYAAGDGVSTMELHLAQERKIVDQELDRVYAMENELIWTLFRMERRGMPLDLGYLQELPKIVQEKIDDAFRELPEGFNPRSPKQVKQLCEDAGNTSWPTTEKGNPSFPEKYLETFEEGRNVVAVRKWSNLLNSFVTPLIEEHNFNGRVHPTINQLKGDDAGTVARLSCSRPNLQQVPKHDKMRAKLLRRVFCADEGYEFNEADYSQCEPRMFAHYSGDKNLIDGYSQTPPKDVHSIVAEMFDADRSTVAKRMNMGMFTGMFPKSFAGHMGWTIAEATAKWNQWFDLFPGIKGFQDMAKKVMLQRGFVKTILGRRGRLEKPRFAYKGTSKIIQGGNADIMKYKLVEVDKMLEAGGDVVHLMMSVHDSMIWQNPKTEEGRAVSAEIVRIMEDVQSDPFNLILPFKVDLDAGENWAEASFGEG